MPNGTVVVAISMLCAGCGNQVSQVGDHLCRECVGKLMRKLDGDVWFGFKVGEAFRKEPS